MRSMPCEAMPASEHLGARRPTMTTNTPRLVDAFVKGPKKGATGNTAAAALSRSTTMPTPTRGSARLASKPSSPHRLS